MKKLDSRAHIEIARCADNCIKYCSKQESRIGEVVELGTRPFRRNSKQDWDQIWDLAKQGKMEDIPAEIRVKHYRTLKEISKDHLVMQEDVPETKGVWYMGPSGCGKSRKARTENKGAYIKMANKWWDGYRQESVVILDDLDPEHNRLAYHLKIWGDHYGCILETKGGAIPSAHKKIIVTSQYMPDEIFSAEDAIAIKRRYQLFVWDANKKDFIKQ